MELLRMSLEYIQMHTPENNVDTEFFHNSLKIAYILVIDQETF